MNFCEQIFECYGPHYYEMIKSMRQEMLQRFHFICECIACENEWPLFMTMISSGLVSINCSPSYFQNLESYSTFVLVVV